MESADTPGSITVGVLSDTHGHLYPQVVKLLVGVDHIIHAGDIGSPQVLAALRAIAQVTAVRGNCDHYEWAVSLPAEAEVELAGVRILVGHIAGRLNETRQGFRVVVTGHTHRMESVEREGVLYLNPGSAGPARFGHPRTMARLRLTPPARSGAPAQVRAEFLMVPEA
jgi:putative phosphoesterase